MLGKIINILKNNQIRLPVWCGILIAHIPYSWRPVVGPIFKRRITQIKEFDEISEIQKKEIIFQQIFEIVKYSIDNIPFYREFYSRNGFSLDMLQVFDDIKKIPVVTKDDLLTVKLSQRSNTEIDSLLVNTGGSSGKTLSFYIEPNAIPHEAAHGSTMWKELGYKRGCIRLLLVGRSKVKNGADYEFARNCYSLDMYQPYKKNKRRLIELLRKHPCEYLQGYPSVLSEFADFCREQPDLLELICCKLKGVFLNSEFPYPIYRDNIESVFQVPSQAFYGHTERCVMAYEKKGLKNVYHPFQTYGFTEVQKRDDGHYDLIGTSYFNHASPLIRYNTNDIVDNPCFVDGILESFEIIEGRSGQFVKDKNGRDISLTGLLMGRHHQLFDYCDHIQITQKEQGKAIILYVPKEGKNIDSPSSLFDSSNIDIDFDFKPLNKPIRTASGKINLLVKYEQFDNQSNH